MKKTIRTIGLCITSIALTYSISATAAPSENNHKKFRPAETNRAIEDQYIVVLKDDFIDDEIVEESTAVGRAFSAKEKKQRRKEKIDGAARHISNKHDAKIRHEYHAKLGGFSVTMNKQQLEDMLKDDRVAYIEQDQRVYLDATQQDATWGLDRIDQEDLPLDTTYSYEYTGAGVTAYVIDTGIVSNHPEFDGRVAAGVDYIGDGYGTEDCYGHGTHVAGTIGGATYGVAKGVTLVPLRIFACSGYASYSDILAALNWVLDNASFPAVVNMSISGGNSSTYTSTVTELVDAGITVVAAAGNDTTLACNYSPASIPAAITVGASTDSDYRAYFSNYGSCVDLFAPGYNIRSASMYGGYTNKSGTSMAAPHVAGAVALYLEKNPSADRYEIEANLEANATADTIMDIVDLDTPNLLLQTGFLAASGSQVTLPIQSASDWGGSTSGFDANNVIDGDLAWASRWEATGSPVHLELDLGSIQRVSDVGISWGWGAQKTYSFEIWARASQNDSWTKVRVKGDTTGTTSSIEAYDITDFNARYLRIKTHGNSEGSDITVIKEVEVYGVSDASQVSIANAFDDGSAHKNYPASNAIDGSTDWSTRWAAYDETAVNLTLELEESSYITNVAIAWGRGDQYTHTFEIYARNATSGSWTKVFDSVSSGQVDGFEVFDIVDVTAKQIRIKSFGSSDNSNWTNINEVKLYGAVPAQ